MSSNLMTNFVTTFSRTTKENIKGLYKHPATIRHKGTVLAFVMDDERRIWYSVLALDEALKKSEENQGTNESKPTLDLDKDHWTDPAELFFPTEISKVGFGVADQTRLPVFAKDVPTPQPVGTILPSRASEIRPFEPDYFHSTTARFTADTAFQVLSDGKYVYLFRQAIDEDHRDMLFIDPDGKFYSDKNDEAVTKDTGNPLVNGHLLVDRYLLLGTQLRSVREVRYQRSRSKTRPASRKDGLGAQDLDGNAFYEPTQQLRFVRSIKDGHFTVLLLPTAVAEVERWQIFTHNSKTGLIDTYNVERSADGWFNTRGTQVYTCVDSDETNTRKTGEHGKVYLGKPGKCVEPSLADPSRSCGKDLIKRTITEGYAESALNFKNGDAYIELTGGGIALTQGSASLRHLFSVDSQLADKSKRKEFTDALNKGFLSLERQLSAKFTIKEEGLAAKRLEITDSGKEYLLILEDQRLNVYSVEARFTLEAWIYPEDSGSSIQTLITGHGEIDDSLSASRSDPKTCPSLWIVDHRRLQIGFGDGTSWNEYTTDSLLKPGAWNHIAVTFDGVAFRIFVDGALRAKSETADIYENGVKIHAWNDKEITGSNGNTPLPNLLSDKSPSGSAITFFGSKSNSFTGQIDEIRIWKRARTKDELFADRHQRLTGFEPGLAGYWRFDEYRGDTVYDQTDQNAYGTIHGGYKWTASQAPVGQNPGVNRNSFRVEGRSVASGLTALLYYQQEPVASGYSGEEKPLKQKGRVMLAMATQAEAGPTESDKPYIAVLDFAVSQEGRLAQIPDVVSLEPVNKTGQDEQSMNDLLDEISAAENRWAELSDKEKDVNKKNRDKFNNSVQTEPMRLVHVDPFGLTTSGALLDFAWSKDTPQLFDSATGKLALYFRGVANQFFVTYYDTLTERATYPLTDKTNPLTDKTNETVLCKARSAELEMDKIVIEIGGEDENTCTVEVSGAGMQETWRRVPRDAKEFAAVLNGERNKRSFIGRGRLKFKYGVAIGLAMESDLEKVEPGDVLMVGGARVVVERKDKSYFEISSDETNLTNERLPVFKLPYDYARLAHTTKVPGDLYYGSLLITAGPPTTAGFPVESVANQVVTGGGTRNSVWTAEAPGSTLRFDGTSSAQAKEDLQKFAPTDDLTLEAWVRPDGMENGKEAQLIQYQHGSNSYALGLKKQELRSALHFDGTNDYATITASEKLNFEGAITIEAWIKPEAINGTRNIFAHGYPHTNTGEVFLRLEDNKYQIGGFKVGNSPAFASIPIPSEDKNQWVHLAGVYDSNEKKWILYRNGMPGVPPGVPFTSDIGAFTLVADWGIGANPNPNKSKDRRLFEGSIDEVRIWNKARKQEDIRADMHRRLGGSETGLVGYWHFEDAASGTVPNSAGDWGEAVIHGDPQVVASPLPGYSVFASANGMKVEPRHGGGGNALLFDSKKDYLRVPYQEDLNPDQFTISCWVRVTGGEGSFRSPMTSRIWTDNTTHQGYCLYAGSDNKWQVMIGNGTKWVKVSGPEVNKNTWTHICATYDGKNLVLYIDGIETGVFETNFKPNLSAPLRIGAGEHQNEFMYHFVGQIDEVCIWNKARKEWQIKNDMNRRLVGDEPDLVGYWRFEKDGNNKVIARDYSLAGNHGTGTGTPELVDPAPLAPVYQTFAGGSWTHLASILKQAYGLKFNGQADTYLDCGNAAALDINGDLTIEVWLQVDEINKNQTILSRGELEGKPSNKVPYSLAVDGGKIAFAFEDKDGNPHSFKTSASIAAKKPLRIVVTRKLRTESLSEDTKPWTLSWHDIAIYIDDKPEEFKYTTGSNHKNVIEKYLSEKDKLTAGDLDPLGDNTRVKEIGKNDQAVEIGKVFNGIISEVRIWNKAINKELVGKEVEGDDQPAGWWRFREGKGREVADSAGQSKATLNGSADWVPAPDPLQSTLELYVDGRRLQATAQKDDPAANNSAGFRLGEGFQGELEEVRIWKTMRTQEQIQDNLFRRLTGEVDDLIAYYTFDTDANNQLIDQAGHGNDLTINRTRYVLSTAPVGVDIPQARSALAGIHTRFNELIGSRPAVQEYADMQADRDGNLIGIFKRFYTYIQDGRWQLVTGFKVGDMVTEWIGQVQFAPQLIGYIEGAPPVPGENLTQKSQLLAVVGDPTSYNEASSIEFVEADETTNTYASSKDHGFDFESNLKFLFGFKEVVFLTAFVGKNLTEFGNTLGPNLKFEHSQSWLTENSRSVGQKIGKSTSLELRGRYTTPEEAENEYFGRRFLPDNVGLALVQSETADVFALRLKQNNALIAYQMRPNPDIDKDWNIIHFPINPRYTKQGTLDGKVGPAPDVDYPHALTYSDDSSYFKPREAYEIKKVFREREKTRKGDYDKYLEDQLSGDIGSTTLDVSLPAVIKRDLMNTYVWTADGGLFAETQETMDAQSDMIGGSYQFKGMAGVSTEGETNILSGAMKWDIDLLFGGHYNRTATKTKDSQHSFALNVSLNKVERDIYLRDEKMDFILDNSDPKRPRPVKTPYKVDAYRFMTFYLEPDSDNHDTFFQNVVDPIWLSESDDPNAAALREAQQDGKKPGCWRVMHRVTYVSRVLPPLDESAPPSLEKTMRTLDIDSNYELIKKLEPFVSSKLSSYTEFATAVDDALKNYLPELQSHAEDIKRFLSLYYGIDTAPSSGGDADLPVFGQESLAERTPNQPPVVNAGRDETIYLDGSRAVLELKGTVIDDRIDQTEAIFVTWEQVGGEGSVTFDDPHALPAKATFSKRGRYELKLTASDGELEASDTVTVTVNETPRISASRERPIQVMSATQMKAELNGKIQANDDQLKILDDKLHSLLGSKTLSDEAQKNQKESLEEQGRELDDQQDALNEYVEFLEANTNNESYAARLVWTLDDDGLGDPAQRDLAVTVNWSKVEGVKFKNDKSLDTLATFAKAGTYLLTVEVNNGSAGSGSVKDEVMVSAGLRSTDQLQAFYTFKESDPGTIHDFSHVKDKEPLSLSTLNAGVCECIPSGGLGIKAPTRYVTAAARKIIDSVKKSQELTVEVWFAPSSNDDDRLAHMVSLTSGTSGRNFLLAQSGNSYFVSLRTATTNATGSNKTLAYEHSPQNEKPIYLVCTRDAEGWLRLFINGKEQAGRKVSGDLSAWDNQAKLTLANDLGDTEGVDHAWLGSLHLLAVYSRALETEEVSQHFRYGPDTSLPPRVRAGEDQVTNHETIELKGGIKFYRPVPPGSIRWEQVSGPGDAKFEPGQAGTEVTFVRPGRYVLSLTAEDGGMKASDKVAIVVNRPPEVELVNPPTNPLALTGSTVTVRLEARIIHDGLGDPPGKVTTKWALGSGPAPVKWSDPNALTTDATFSKRGLYKLKLTVDNGHHKKEVPLEITVDEAPVVEAGPSQTITLSNGQRREITLQGTVKDRGLGNKNQQEELGYKWEVEKIGSAGDASDAEIIPDSEKNPTKAEFKSGGIYRFTFTATNYHATPVLSGQDTVDIIVNQAPKISIFGPKTAFLPSIVTFEAIVSDDGLPDTQMDKAVTFKWSVPGNPKGMNLDSTNGDNTVARFTKAGTYTLQLEAADGTEKVTKTVNIEIKEIEPADIPENGLQARVTATTLNVRSGPVVKGDNIIGTLNKNELILLKEIVVENGNIWAKQDEGGWAAMLYGENIWMTFTNQD